MAYVCSRSYFLTLAVIPSYLPMPGVNSVMWTVGSVLTRPHPLQILTVILTFFLGSDVPSCYGSALAACVWCLRYPVPLCLGVGSGVFGFHRLDMCSDSAKWSQSEPGPDQWHTGIGHDISAMFR